MLAPPAALIAHDLKNALSALENELAQLAQNPDQALAHQAHQRCMALRREFVEFLVVYGTDGPLRALCEDECPQDLLVSVSRSAAMRYAGQASITLSIEPEATCPAFWYFDPRLVQLAMDAAVNNAYRFARTQVVLRARAEQDFLVLAVDDDGPGFTGHTTSESSTGLGTELCRRVAAAHRSGGRTGRVELLERLGGGARFELWLP